MTPPQPVLPEAPCHVGAAAKVCGYCTGALEVDVEPGGPAGPPVAEPAAATAQGVS